MVATSLSKVSVSQDVEKKILTAIELKKELEKYETEIKEALMIVTGKH